jgi:hypothetical protein
MKPDEKRVVSHPKDVDFAAKHATTLGLRVQVDPWCPPGTVFVSDPSRLSGGPDGDDEGWENSVGRIDFG